MFHIVNDELAIAGTLVESDLDELLRRGYRTIIDLRGDGEAAPGGLRPCDELPLAAARGLRYEQIPVCPQNLAVLTVREVGRAIAAAEPRILVHCASGTRASFFAAMHLACAQGWTVGRCLAEITRAGVSPDEAPGLRDLLVEYVVGHLYVDA